MMIVVGHGMNQLYHSETGPTAYAYEIKDVVNEDPRLQRDTDQSLIIGENDAVSVPKSILNTWDLEIGDYLCYFGDNNFGIIKSSEFKLRYTQEPRLNNG